MSKRLRFTRGADRYDAGDVVFDRGGHSKEVPDDVAELLLELEGFDFEEITPDDQSSEAEKDRAEDAYAAEVEKATAKVEEENRREAKRRAAIYESQSLEETADALEEVDQHSSSTAPSEDTGGSSPEVADEDAQWAEESELQAAIEAEIEPDKGSQKRPSA